MNTFNEAEKQCNKAYWNLHRLKDFLKVMEIAAMEQEENLGKVDIGWGSLIEILLAQVEQAKLDFEPLERFLAVKRGEEVNGR